MADRAEIIDLSHVIEDGMVTYKGLPAPHICDFWTRDGSAANYDDGATFQIGKIEMVANTGTYLDSPFHRYADGADLSELDIRSLADVPGIVIRAPWENGLAVGPNAFNGREVTGKAVLIHTGWDRHWRTDAYFGEHPYLTDEAADWLASNGATIVGIDSVNIDNMHTRARPVHTRLLGAGIPICEHMTGLDSLPDDGFGFAAVPPKVKGMGTFPVRAYAVLG
jgi:kynurenine formamidase